MVRTSSQKTIYDKGYMYNWTTKHFTMSQALPGRNGIKRRLYKLMYYTNYAVIGSWYPIEIQKITDNQYRMKAF